MSRSPKGTSDPVSSPTSACSLLPRTAPRVWMPTRATPSEPGFFSTISWAIRTSVRRRSSRSRTTLSFVLNTCPFLASQDRVKGTDAATLAAVPPEPHQQAGYPSLLMSFTRFRVERPALAGRDGDQTAEVGRAVSREHIALEAQLGRRVYGGHGLKR